MDIGSKYKKKPPTARPQVVPEPLSAVQFRIIRGCPLSLSWGPMQNY